MGFAIPKLDKPGDILTLLANPEKYKEYAERLMFLRDEAEAKLGDLATRDAVDRYVQEKRLAIDKLGENAAKEHQKAIAAREAAEYDKKLIAEQLKVAQAARQSIEAGRYELVRDRETLTTAQKALEGEAVKLKDAWDRRHHELDVERRQVQAMEAWARNFVTLMQAKFKEMPS